MAVAHLASMHEFSKAPQSSDIVEDGVLPPALGGSYLCAAAATGVAVLPLDSNARAQIGGCWRAVPPLQVGMPAPAHRLFVSHACHCTAQH